MIHNFIIIIISVAKVFECFCVLCPSISICCQISCTIISDCILLLYYIAIILFSIKDYLQNLKSHKNKLPSIIIWTTFSWLDRYCVTFCSHIWIWIIVIDFLMINSLTLKILMTWRQAFFHDLMYVGHDLSYKLIQGPHFSMWYMSNAIELYLSFTLWKIMHHFFGIFGWYTRKCFLFLY